MIMSVFNRLMPSWVVRAVILLLLVPAVSCRQKKEKEDVARVGVILPLSGDMSSYGEDCKKGIQYAAVADSLEVEYIFEDSRGSSDAAIAAFNKLTTLDKVDYVIGDMFSQTTEAMAPLAKKRQVLLVSPTASSRKISKNNIFALSVFPSETYESKLVAEFAKGRYERVGILYEKVAAAQAMHDAFVEVFGEDGIVFDEAFDSSIASFRDIVFKMKKSGCKAVYLVTYINNAVKLVTQMKGLGLAVDLMGQSALYDPSLYEYLHDYDAAFYLTGPLFNAANEDPMSRSFVEGGFKSVCGVEANQMSTQGYVAAVVANDLYRMIKDGDYSRERILEYRKQFFGSEFRFDDRLTSTSGLRMYKYESDNFIPLEQ